MIVTLNKMSDVRNLERKENIKDNVEQEFMMFFAIKGLCITVDDFPRLTLQDLVKLHTDQRFDNEADSAQG